MNNLDKTMFTLVEWDYKMWLNDIGWENKKEHKHKHKSIYI